LLLYTDQNMCYDVHGNHIECRNSGHDAGFKQPDMAVLASRYRVQGDSIKDNLSGLVWKKYAGLSEFPLSWPEAQQFVAEINNSVKQVENRWRLPTRRELFSLVSHQFVNPSLSQGHPFTDVFNGYYWTGTSCARLHDQAWYIHMGGGRVYRGMKHGSYMVWPVRGQMHHPTKGRHRFRRHTGVYFDRYTNRLWYTGSDLLTRPRTWEEALLAIRKLNDDHKKGFGDWRLPNIRELESLVDDSRHSPAFEPGFSTAIAQITGCWSSTTSIYEPRYAWVLYSIDGAVGVGFKVQAEYHTLAVRHDDADGLNI